jgi:RNA polymerase sigma-70 factor (ECF subfamily)
MPEPAIAADGGAMTTCHPDGCAGLCTEAGLSAAFAEHHQALVARARRMVVDPHLAEEVAQEAFTRAWRACHRFDPRRGPLRPWLLAITANVAKDRVKARVRRPAVTRADLADRHTAVDGGLDRVLVRAALVEALGTLSTEHRDALVHTYLLDRPSLEVAEQLGIKRETLRTRVHYALHRLRAELEPAW